jgi:MFS family permease
MQFDFHVPHYFSKGIRSEIQELSVSTGLADFAIAMVTIFEPIFLHSVLGLSVQEVLLFMAAVYACYIVLIPFGAKVTSVLGYRRTLAFSIPFQVLFWVFILAGKVSITYLWFAPLIYAIEKSLFWPGFHAIVSRYASREQKGREFGAIYAIVNIANMLGPFVGGFLSERYGLQTAFFSAGAIYCLSAIPLLIEKEIFVPKLYQYRETWQLYFEHPKKFLGYMGFGEEVLGLTIWPIFIFSIVKAYEGTGVLATVSSFIAAILALVVGKITDAYTKRVLVKVGAFFMALTWAVRFVATNFWSAFAMDSFSRTAKDIVFIPLSTLTYLRAEASHILPYVVFFEQSLAVGKMLACLLGILIFTLLGGGPVAFIGLFILAGVFSFLYMFI